MRFLLIIILIGVLALIFKKAYPSGQIVSPIPPEPKQSASLQTVVQKELEGATGSYGIIIKNLKTDEYYSLNSQKTFLSASLYKLWVMGTVYQQIKDGALHEDDVLSQEISVLNEEFYLDPETAEETEGTMTLSVKDALTQMISISDNYAALLLTEKVKLSSVASFLPTNGLTQSKVGTHGDAPTVTAYDMALFWEKLYENEIVDKQSSKEMLDLLKKQQVNNKIPKDLPEKIITAHKTGELDKFSHDAGIVFTPKGDYLIVVLSESETPSLAEETIAKISLVVYNYFTK